MQPDLSGSSFVCVGVFMGAFGVKGALRLKSFTQRPVDVFAFSPVYWGKQRIPAHLKKLKECPESSFISEIQGVHSREEALSLKGEKIYVEKEQLPPLPSGEFYYADLVGLEVKVRGKPWGTVAAVHNFGAGDILEVSPIQGHSTAMIPFSEEMVLQITLGQGMVVDPDLLADYSPSCPEKREG